VESYIINSSLVRFGVVNEVRKFISKSDPGSISWYMVVFVEGLYDKNCLLVGVFPSIVIFSTMSSNSQTTSCTGSKPVMDLDSFIYYMTFIF
jgi:hypothetical protein